MKKIVSFLFLFFLLNGCATTIVKYTNTQYAPTNANKIKVYQTSLPKKEYIELAEIILSEGKDVEKIKEEASKLGADAIIITGCASKFSYNFVVGMAITHDRSTLNNNDPILQNNPNGFTSSKEVGIKCVAIKFEDGEIVKTSSGTIEKR